MIKIAGKTNANINIFKYLFITLVNLETFCIFNPKIKEDVPSRNDTTVSKFCVTEVTRALFVLWVVAYIIWVWFDRHVIKRRDENSNGDNNTNFNVSIAY